MPWFASLIPAAIEGVVGIFTKHQETKVAKDTARAKLQAKRSDAKFQLDLSDKEWEVVAKKVEASSKKDEWVTLVFMIPILLIMVAPFFGKGFQDSVTLAINNLSHLFDGAQLHHGDVLAAVTFAAIGLKFKPSRWK